MDFMLNLNVFRPRVNLGYSQVHLSIRDETLESDPIHENPRLLVNLTLWCTLIVIELKQLST